MSRILFGLSLLILMGLAWTGLNGGYELLTPSHTPGQKVQAFTQMGFGLFALLSLVTTFRGRRWQSLSFACFAVSLAIAAGLFVVAWNHMSPIAGGLTGVAAFGIALGIQWLLRVERAGR